MDNINYRGPGIRQLIQAIAVTVDVDIEAVGVACRDVRKPPVDLVTEEENDEGAAMCRLCEW